jgi:hypothetical protein
VSYFGECYRGGLAKGNVLVRELPKPSRQSGNEFRVNRACGCKGHIVGDVITYSDPILLMRGLVQYVAASSIPGPRESTWYVDRPLVLETISRAVQLSER